MKQPSVSAWLSLMPIMAERGWRISDGLYGGRIRAVTSPYECPLVALAKEIDPQLWRLDGSDYEIALEELGLSRRSLGALILVDAADIREPRLPEVARARERLKVMLGIREPSRI